MSKNYLVPTNIIVSLDPCPLSSIFLYVGNVSRRVLVRRKSVSGDDSSLRLLGLQPKTRSTVSLCDSVSISESDEVACWCTLLSGGCRGCWRPIELYSNLPMCALIIAAFSVFFPLKVILWWEKYKDSSSILKDDSLSELYSPTQSGYFVLLEDGGGSDAFLFRYLWRVMHKSNLGSGRATTFLAKNFLNTLDDPHPSN